MLYYYLVWPVRIPAFVFQEPAEEGAMDAEEEAARADGNYADPNEGFLARVVRTFTTEVIVSIGIIAMFTVVAVKCWFLK